MLLCMLVKVVLTFLITRLYFELSQEVCDQWKPHTPPLVVLSPEFSWETCFSVLFCFVCFLSVFFFLELNLWQLLIWRKGNVCGIIADPLCPYIYFFLIFFILTENWWDCGEFSIGFVKISSGECNGWREREPWLKSNFKYFFSCSKVSLFSFWTFLWLLLYYDKPCHCFSAQTWDFFMMVWRRQEEW